MQGRVATQTEIRDGHHVELLLNGDSTYPRLWQDLRSAYKSIELQLYADTFALALAHDFDIGPLAGSQQPAMLHAKTMIIDGLWATVGAMNFDNRSLAINDEANLLVADATFARELEQVFLDDLRSAREFKLELFVRRSWRSRISDVAAVQVAKLL